MGGLAVLLLPSRVWTGQGVAKIASRLPLIGGVSAGAALGVILLTARFGFCAGFAGMAGVLAAAFLVYGAVINPRLTAETREFAAYCRRVALQVPPGETLYVPAAGGAEGFWHFYVGRTLPSREGGPGLYLASEGQEKQLRKAGARLEVLDAMLDREGHGRYLLRVNP